jgi:anti-sigma factor RsiW
VTDERVAELEAALDECHARYAKLDAKYTKLRKGADHVLSRALSMGEFARVRCVDLWRLK